MQKVKFSPEPQKLKETVRRLLRVRIQLTRRQWIVAVAALAAVAALLIWLLRPQTQQPVYPIVAVEPVTTDNVNIYGEYVGRIRAQQFVEVHARVEGYLEQMLSPKERMSTKDRPSLSSIRNFIAPGRTGRGLS